eukprot:jgi/Galph1/6028/GphlegSOOS_G4726.1
MGKSKKLGQKRLDKYYHLAKEQGFRSRAAFKLIQLNRKYDFLGSARAVVDLCAAPGGWLQVVRKETPVACSCVAVDLVPIRPITGTICLTHDITKDTCLSSIRNALAGVKPDVVLCDGSPSMGTSWLQDAYTQAELTLAALKLAVSLLRPHGWFVAKVFRSSEYTALVHVLNQFFGKVVATKPRASRTESAEIYVICSKFRDVKNVDMKLLDPRVVFKEQESDTQRMNSRLIMPTERKPNRSGYSQESHTSLIRKYSVLDFINTSEPIAILNQDHVLEFDDQEECKWIRSLPVTTEDILESCKDLQVLGPKDQKRLLKWRKQILNEKKRIQKNKEQDASLDEDSLSVSESSSLKDSEDSYETREKERLRKSRKKLQKLQKREKKRKEREGVDTSHLVDSSQEQALFSLPTKKDTMETIAEGDWKNIDEDDNLEEKQSKRNSLSVDEERYLYSVDTDDNGFSDQYEHNPSGWEETNHVDVPDSSSDSEVEYSMKRWFSHPLFDETDQAVSSFNEDKESRKTCEDKESLLLKRKRTEDDLEATKLNSSPVSGSEDESLDIDETSRALALAQKMIRKKSREELLDDAWNRYVFDDENAPRWFLEEEKKYRRAPVAISESNVESMKASLEGKYAQYLNRKEQEALLRNKRREARRLRRMDAEIEKIESQPELSTEEKQKSIEKLLKRNRMAKKKKRQVAYAVVRPGGGKMIVGQGGKGRKAKVPKGAKIKYVDRRMKKDLRGRKKKNGFDSVIGLISKRELARLERIFCTMSYYDTIVPISSDTTDKKQSYEGRQSGITDYGQDFEYGTSVATCMQLVRLGFLRKVYGILSLQLGLTVFVSALFMMNQSVSAFILRNIWLLWIGLLTTLGSLFALIFYKNQHPINMYLLGLFTAAESYMIGTICAIYSVTGQGWIVFQAFLLTALVFTSLTAYCFNSKKDFSFLGGFLWAALLCLFGAAMVNMVLGWTGNYSPGFSFLISVVGSLIFCGYILFDTSLLINHLSPDEYVLASISLYLDVINLFMYLLRILSYLQSDNN